MVEYIASQDGHLLNIEAKYYNKLDIEAFSQMMKDPSYCYKFYWLEAVVHIISEGKNETTFDEIIDEMIANAWYSVREFHIHLSGIQVDGLVRDGLERAILQLTELSDLPANASKIEIKNAIREHQTDLKKAKEHGVTVSFDLNYRAKLWTEDVEGKQKMLSDMMPYVDICFGNARDAAKCLGYTEGDTDFINGDYSICVDEEHMTNVMKHYGFTHLITTLRNSISASDNGWSGAICTSSGLYQGSNYNLHIVERVGGGDSFASGVLHGILSDMGAEKALEFGLAAAAIKHTIPGDLNFISENEVLALMYSDGAGRVQR